MACRGSALYRGMIGYLRTGGGADPDPPGADPIRILPRSGHQWCLNYSWCGVRLDHRRREAGLSCIPGLTLVSLLDRVEGCYKCQPLRLEAISHTRDAHFRNIRGRSNNNNNNGQSFFYFAGYELMKAFPLGGQFDRIGRFF